MTKIYSKGFVNTKYANESGDTQYFDGVTGVSKRLKDYIPMVIRLKIKTPPDDLVLLVNPSSFSRNLAKKITPSKTRADSFSSGYVVQFARDEMDTIQADGMIAMMYSSKYGLCSTDKLSQSYDHFLKLLAFYENNGVNFDSKFYPVIESVGRVVISYDGCEYFGCFDDFSYKQVASDPFNFSFSWSFSVSSFVNGQSDSFAISQPNIQKIQKIENKKKPEPPAPIVTKTEDKPIVKSEEIIATKAEENVYKGKDYLHLLNKDASLLHVNTVPEASPFKNNLLIRPYEASLQLKGQTYQAVNSKTMQGLANYDPKRLLPLNYTGPMVVTTTPSKKVEQQTGSNG